MTAELDGKCVFALLIIFFSVYMENMQRLKIIRNRKVGIFLGFLWRLRAVAHADLERMFFFLSNVLFLLLNIYVFLMFAKILSAFLRTNFKSFEMISVSFYFSFYIIFSISSVGWSVWICTWMNGAGFFSGTFHFNFRMLNTEFQKSPHLFGMRISL